MAITITTTEANSRRITKDLEAEGKKVTRTIYSDSNDKVTLVVRDKLRTKIRNLLKLN